MSKRRKRMILTTTEHIEGYNIQTLGLVQGSTIQSKNMFKDMGSGFKSMVGGGDFPGLFHHFGIGL